MAGPSTTFQVGTYGEKGVAASANTPGARVYPMMWADNSGQLWLFGGSGYGNTSSTGKSDQ